MARDRRELEYPVKKKTPVRVILGFLITIGMVAVILIVLFPVYSAMVKAETGAMSPSIAIGETVGVNHVAYLLLPPKRGDIIEFKISKNTLDPSIHSESSYIRRIVGMPGETIQITEGVVYINGVPLQENYCSGEMTYGGTATTAFTLSSDEYFVMADNRSNNFDSRDSTVGPVSGQDIIGKVWVRLLPISEFGFL